MVWRLPATSSEVFQRNTLVQVVCQLRFHPILKVAERLPDFQERVRHVFPDFSEQTTAVAAMTAEGAVELQQEKQFLFRKVHASCTLALTSGSLAVEEKKHAERANLFEDVLLAIRALVETQQHVQPKRLGLRYINIIDREQIAKDLGESVEWADLVSSPFLKIPDDLADLEQTNFYSEIRSPTNARGELALRYGLLRSPDGVSRFRFDVDRYCESDFTLDDVASILETFGDDTFHLFMKAAGNKLLRWMRGSNLGGA